MIRFNAILLSKDSSVQLQPRSDAPYRTLAGQAQHIYTTILIFVKGMEGYIFRTLITQKKAYCLLL